MKDNELGNVMKQRIPAVLILTLLLVAPAATADRKKPPEGMRKYYLFLRNAAPVPPGEKPEKIKVPDIEKLGGVVVDTLSDYKVIFLPPDKAKHLRRDRAVAHLQRVWMGESFDDWDEGTESALSAVAQTQETDLRWGPKQYEYDGVGNISRITDTTLASSDSFTYDAVSRLTRAEMHGTTEIYEYDSFGNITKKQIIGRSPQTMTVDSTSNRVATETYDVAGNVTSSSGRPVHYFYDSLGMMTGYSGNGRDRRMFYTADDERIGTQWGGTESTSHWTIRDFEGRVLREFRLNGAGVAAGYWGWVEDYIYAGGRLVAGESLHTYAPDNPDLRQRHFHLDHLGSVRLITSEQGDLSLGRHDYYPFGTEQSSFFQEEANFGGWGGIMPEKMRFTGHERDFLGYWNVENTDYLDYMHARYYNPNQGRFLSVDPYLDLHKATRNPQNWNRYSYVRNNPLNLVDPDGRDDVNIGPDFEVAGAPGSPEKHKEFLKTFAQASGGLISFAIATVILDPGLEMGDGELPRRSSVQVNKKAGDAFRDQVADGLKAEGRDVQKEVVKKTPFGPRVIDVEVSQGGRVLGGIETKVGNSPYKPSQRAKDWWLRKVKDFIVVVVRQAL